MIPFEPTYRGDEVDESAAPPISVVDRVLAVLLAFGPDDADLSLAELTRRTGVPKPTVHRLLGQLAASNIVERVDDGWRLGMRLFELGSLAPGQRGLRETAYPFLEDLHQATGDAVHLAVLDGIEVVYVEKLPSRRGSPQLPSRVGGRMPAHCTGVGKALLAWSPPGVLNAVLDAGLERRTTRTIVVPFMLKKELQTAQRVGVAYEREESTPGVLCVACPVIGPDGFAVAAISIARWANSPDVARVAPAVRAVASALSRQLGGAKLPPREGVGLARGRRPGQAALGATVESLRIRKGQTERPARGSRYADSSAHSATPTRIANR